MSHKWSPTLELFSDEKEGAKIKSQKMISSEETEIHETTTVQWMLPEWEQNRVQHPCPRISHFKLQYIQVIDTSICACQ